MIIVLVDIAKINKELIVISFRFGFIANILKIMFPYGFVTLLSHYILKYFKAT